MNICAGCPRLVEDLRRGCAICSVLYRRRSDCWVRKLALQPTPRREEADWRLNVRIAKTDA